MVLLTNVPIVFCDNVSAECLVKNLVLHSRTNHAEIDFNFVREKLQEGKVLVKYMTS